MKCHDFVLSNHKGSWLTVVIIFYNLPFFPLRAEGLAQEIKDLQGKLADYNMVIFAIIWLFF